CTVSGGNTQPASVTANQTTPVTFTITCAATTGSIAVTTTTGGSNLPSGYTVTVDGRTQSVAASGTVTFDGLNVGNHSVGLSPIPSNCSVSGANPQTVAVTGGNTTPVSFSISCTAPPPPPQATHVVFTSQPPSSVLLGASFGATVTAYDDQGNVVTSFTGTVTMSIASSTGVGGSLSGTTQVNAVNGVATFTNLHINAVIGTY